MKFLTREEIRNLTAEERDEYLSKYYELRRFAAALIKDSSRPAIGKLENRCYGEHSNYINYESSMFVYLTNAVYRHILGEENLNMARVYRGRESDKGKTGITIPSMLTLPALVHLNNFYHYIENELVENPKLKFKNNDDVQKFLREARKAYAKDFHINFAFTGRTDDCLPTPTVAKPLNSLDRIASKGAVKQSKEYPVFDEYTIKTMEVYEYLLTRARFLGREPAHIKKMEDTLKAERLSIVQDMGKGTLVQAFFSGSVSEVLQRMKDENLKAQVLASAERKGRKATTTGSELSETAKQQAEQTFGGDAVVDEIKKRFVERNIVSISLVEEPSSLSDGVVVRGDKEFKKSPVGQQFSFSSVSSVQAEEPQTERAEEKKEEQGLKPKKKELLSDELQKELDSEILAIRYKAAKDGASSQEIQEEIELATSRAWSEQARLNFEAEAKKYQGGKQLTIFDCLANMESDDDTASPV